MTMEYGAVASKKMPPTKEKEQHDERQNSMDQRYREHTKDENSRRLAMPTTEEISNTCTTIRHVEPRTTTILCNLIAVRTLASEHVVDRKGAMSDSYEIQERRSETVLSSSEGPFFEREHFSGAHKVALQH